MTEAQSQDKPKRISLADAVSKAFGEDVAKYLGSHGVEKDFHMEDEGPDWVPNQFIGDNHSPLSPWIRPFTAPLRCRI